MRYRFQVGFAVLALAVVAGLTFIAIGSSRTAPPSIPSSDPNLAVSVGTRALSLPPGSTVADALRQADVRPQRGRLLDVLGNVIDPARVAGHVEIDGRTVRMTDLLSDGDHLTVVNGEDRTEPIVRRRTPIDGMHPDDPQFDLSTWHLTRIDEMGRISHTVISTRYVTTGRASTPNAVALTFDDGPSATWTPRILRVLERFHAPATFFTVGYLVEEFPFIVQREIRLGMTIANHSWDHPLAPAFKDQERSKAFAEMERTNRELATLGVTPTLFRPPGGTFDPEVIATADAAGLRLVLWDVDPRDWASGVTKGEIIRNVLDHVRAGSIIELHDGGGDRAATVAALPRIIRGVRKMGYDLVAL